MAKISQLEFLNSLEEEIARQIEFANSFENYTDETLNQKPDSKNWSVFECFEHLNLAMVVYLDQFKKITDFKPTDGLIKFGIKGKFFAEGMRPKSNSISYKMKTFKKLTPSSNLGRSVIKAFLNNSKTLSNFINEHKAHNLNVVKVNTALGPLVKLNAAEAICFVTAHNERHIWQINNILKIVN